MDGFDNIVLWCCCSICGVLLMLVIHPCVVSLLSSCYCLQSPTSKFAFVSAFNVVIMIMVNASLQEELNALKWGKYHHMNEIQQYSIISLVSLQHFLLISKTITIDVDSRRGHY